MYIGECRFSNKFLEKIYSQKNHFGYSLFSRNWMQYVWCTIMQNLDYSTKQMFDVEVVFGS